MNAKVKIGIGASIAIIIASLITYNIIEKKYGDDIREYFDKTDYAMLRVDNTTPYAIEFAVKYHQDDETEITEGWTRVGVGDYKYVYCKISEAQSDFLIAVRSINGDEYFQRAYQTDDTTAHIVWDGEYPIYVSHDDFKYEGVQPVNFLMRVPFSKQPTKISGLNIRSAQYVVTDKEFPQCYPAQASSSISSFVSTARGKAKDFAEALRIQTKFEEWGWKNYNTPYGLGCDIIDENGPRERGVVLKNPYPETIFKQPMTLRDGDILLEFNGHDIYGLEDLLIYLVQHGRDQYRGIQTPYSYGVARGDNYCAGQLTYFFSPDWYGLSDADENRALGRSTAKTWSMGLSKQFHAHGPNAVRGLQKGWNGLSGFISKHTDTDLGTVEVQDAVDAKERKWEYVQDTARYMQFYPDAFKTGEILGLISPSLGGAIIVKGFKTFGGRFVAKTAVGKTATWIVAETIASSIYAASSPSPSGTLLILQDMQISLVTDPSIGFATSYAFKSR